MGLSCGLSALSPRVCYDGMVAARSHYMSKHSQLGATVKAPKGQVAEPSSTLSTEVNLYHAIKWLSLNETLAIAANMSTSTTVEE